MSYASTKLGNILKSIDTTKELLKLRYRENSLNHAISLLNETTIKMDDYLTSEYGNLKSIIVDFVLNEIKTFSIINTKHSKSIRSLKEATELNENYNYLIEYINDYNIYTGDFFKEVLEVEQHIILTQAISRKLLESWGVEGINNHSHLDLGQKESLKMSIFDKTFAELEEKYKTTYKQDENESFEKIKEKFNIGKTENSEKPDIKLSTRATITINGIESEVFEEDIIEAIKNSNAKSILPYKEQIAYYNKITSKEEKDRLLMVFASALIASHNMVWKDIVLQDGEKIIKEMSDSGVYIVEKATNNEITKESKCH